MEFIVYHILSLGIFFLLYHFLLSKSNRFRLNRMLILFFPILPVAIFYLANLSDVSDSIQTINPIQMEEIVVSEESITNLNSADSFSMISWMDFYILISLVSLILVIGTYLKTFILIRSLKWNRDSDQNIHVAYSNLDENFSFFNFIHLHQNQIDDHYILSHEMKHVQARHSYDILLYNLFKVLFWFNPFLFVLERKLKLIHEYEADDFACDDARIDEYSNGLLNQVFGTSSIQFINQFNNQNSIKMRLKMLKQKGKLTSLKKYVAIIPIVGLMFVFGSWNKSVSILDSNSNQEEEVFDKVDKMPEFKGGMSALVQHLGAEIKYPKECEKDNIEGKVFVEFIVDKKGNVMSPKVKKGAHKLLDKEALRVISEMPKWKPGQKGGKKVSVRMVLPIQFKLK